MENNIDNNSVTFKCDKCGLCCRHLDLFGEAYAHLNRGDGICYHLDLDTNLCKIYSHRPLICNVKDGYKLFSHLMSYEEFLEKNYQGCKMLKVQFADKQ